MSRKVIVRISWSVKKPLQMASFALGTVSAMKTDDDFLSPEIALNTMTDAAVKVERDYSVRKNGVVAKDNLKTSTILLNSYLHSQAEFVNKIANGNATIIHNAGFESTSDERGAGIKPGIAGFVTLKAISGGGLKAKIAKVKGATNYCFILNMQGVFNITTVGREIFIPSGSEIRIINTTKISVVFNNLKPMEIVKVAVIASNANGHNGMSPVAVASTIL